VSARRGVWSEVREGLGAVVHHPLLRAATASTTLGNLGDGLMGSSGILLLLMTREIGLGPAEIGVVYSGLGLGGLLGAAAYGVVTRLLGPGRTVVGAYLLWGLSYAAMGLAPASPIAVPILAVLMGALGTINPIAGAIGATLRQAVTPDRLQGRVVAVNRVAMWSAVALGSFTGGVLADHVGIRMTAFVSGLLPLSGGVLVLLSPVSRLRRLDSLGPPCSDDC
jgi:predicted MFS family arabinose efflux permease